MLDKLEIILINLFIQIFVYLLFYTLAAIIGVFVFSFFRVNRRSMLITGFVGGMSALMYYYYCLYIKIVPFTLISDHIIGL